MNGGLREESSLVAFHLVLDPLLWFCIELEKGKYCLQCITAGVSSRARHLAH